MKWESANIPTTSVLNFVDVAFENLPDELRDKITNLISKLKLESRSNIEGQFRTFVELCKGSKTPQMLIIKGEWGEGKTTLFNVYIDRLKKEYSRDLVTYSTRMDRVLDIFERKLRENIRLSVHNLFLASIMEDIIIKLKEEGSPLVFSLQKFGEINNEDQIFEVIKLLADDHKHIMFFIDEFEAIIGKKDVVVNQVEIVQAIIQAIRAIRGGELRKLISNTGIIPHFIFAMTPYAYSEYIHRLGIEFKGWEQRRRHLIELEPLTRKDVETVIQSLIKEVYFSENIDIEDLFEDRRYLDILFTVSQGNFGSLIQAFNLLLATAKRKHLEVFGSQGLVRINADLIIETFTHHKIYTYVGETEGIDRMLYSETIEFLEKSARDKKYIEIWKKLIASSSILFESEINEEDIKILNKILFNRFGKEVISKVELYPIDNKIEETLVEILAGDNEEISRDTLLTSLRRIMLSIGNDRYLPLPQYEESIKRNLSEMLSKMFSFSAIITISPKTLEKIYMALNRYVEQTNKTILTGYTISQPIRERIYPAPPIFVLDFVDPRKALQLWKTAYDSITQNPSAMERNVKLFLITNIPNIEIKNQRPMLLHQYGGQTIELKIELFVYIYFNKERIGPIEQTIKEGRIPVIIAKDSIYNDILEELGETNISNRCIVIPISEIKLIQLAIIQELLQKKRRRELNFEINLHRLEAKLKEIIESLEIEKEVTKLIDTLREEGYVIEDLKLVSRKGIEELIDIYFMFLIGGFEFKLEELWEKHLKKISKTLLYGRGVRKPVVLKRDIESIEPLKNQINALKANGFISEMPGGVLKIQMSKVESKIIEILKEYEDQGRMEVPVSLLRSHFIEIKKAGYDVFLDVYLKILEWRGEIEVNNTFIRRVNELELNKKLDKLYKEFIQKKTKILNLEIVQKNPGIAHIAMFKEHEPRFISIDQLESIIEDYLAEKYTLSKAQKKLLSEYIDYVNNTLLEKIKMSVEEINKRYKNLLYELEDTYTALNRVRDFIAEFDPDFDVSLINEFTSLKAFEDNLHAILNTSQAEILNMMIKEHKEVRKARKLKQHPLYFAGQVHNYTLYLIMNLEERFEKFKTYFNRDVNIVSQIMSEIITFQNKINRIIQEIEQVAEEYMITVEIPKFEYKYKIKTMMPLEDLYNGFKGFLENSIKPYYKQLQELYDSINSLIQDYKMLQEKIEKLESNLRYTNAKILLFKQFISSVASSKVFGNLHCDFDINEADEIISKLRKELSSSREELGKIFSNTDYIKLIQRELENVERALSRINNKISAETENIKHRVTTIINETKSIIAFLRELQNKNIVDLPDKIILTYQEAEDIIKDLETLVNLEETTFLNKGTLLVENMKNLSDKRKEVENAFIKLEQSNLQVAIFKLLITEPKITLQKLVSSLEDRFSREDIINSLIELEKKGLITSYLSLTK